MVDYRDDIRNVIKSCSDLTLEQIIELGDDINVTKLGLDSLALVEAIIEIEKKFNIVIELGGAWMEELEITVNVLNTILNEKING